MNKKPLPLRIDGLKVLLHSGTWRVGKNTFARFSAQVWARLISLALLALIARYQGTAALGRYVLALTVTGIAGALFDMGLNIFMTRESARVDAATQRLLLGALLPLKLALAVPGLGILVSFSLLLSLDFDIRLLIILAGASIPFDALTGAMAALINGRQRMEISGILSAVSRSIWLLSAFLVLSLGYGIPAVLLCMVWSALLSTILHGIVLWRWGLLARWQWSFKIWQIYLAESYPFALTGLIAMLYMRVDLILIGWWQGDIAAGWYGAAYRLWEAVGLIPASMLDALFPEMSRMSVTTGGMKKLRKLLYQPGLALLGAGLVLAIAGYLSATTLVKIIYGSSEDFAATILVFQLLVWAIPAMFIYLLSGHILYALGKQGEVTRWIGAVAIANIGLNIAVIPRWGYLGAAVVALSSELCLAGLLYTRVIRAFQTQEE